MIYLCIYQLNKEPAATDKRHKIMKTLFIASIDYSSNSQLNSISKSEQEFLKRNGFKGLLESEYNGETKYVFVKVEENESKEESFSKYIVRQMCISFENEPSYKMNLDYLKSIGFVL